MLYIGMPLKGRTNGQYPLRFIQHIKCRLNPKLPIWSYEVQEYHAALHWLKMIRKIQCTDEEMHLWPDITSCIQVRLTTLQFLRFSILKILHVKCKNEHPQQQNDLSTG